MRLGRGAEHHARLELECLDLVSPQRDVINLCGQFIFLHERNHGVGIVRDQGDKGFFRILRAVDHLRGLRLAEQVLHLSNWAGKGNSRRRSRQGVDVDPTAVKREKRLCLGGRLDVGIRRHDGKLLWRDVRHRLSFSPDLDVGGLFASRAGVHLIGHMPGRVGALVQSPRWGAEEKSRQRGGESFAVHRFPPLCRQTRGGSELVSRGLVVARQLVREDSEIRAHVWSPGGVGAG